MTEPSRTRMALTTAAALAAVGVASLVLTFTRADADTSTTPEPTRTIPRAEPTTITAPVPSTTLVAVITAPAATSSTIPVLAAPASLSCMQAPYLVIKLPEEPPPTVVVTHTSRVDLNGDCLRFEQWLTVAGYPTVQAAFVDKDAACAAVREHDEHNEEWAVITSPPVPRPSAGTHTSPEISIKPPVLEVINCASQ